jgi:choline-sulfatase
MSNAPPDILFIFSDQHAQRVAGCYGDTAALTPNLDALARRGVLFENCYSPSPICTPARMSMLTARYPCRQSVWTNEDMLPSDVPTYAHALGAGGHRPMLVGRLHSLGPDQLHGYVERAVGDHSPNWPGVPRHDMGILAETNNPSRLSIDRSGAGRSAYQLLDEDTCEAALARLDDVARRRREGDAQPFALTVGFMLPHAPYVAAPEDHARFVDRVPGPRLPPPAPGAEHPWLAWWRADRGIQEVDEADSRRARAAYYALTLQLDRQIGRVLERLHDQGLAENTLVVYASDHGDQIGERGLWWKHTFYDDSVKVPLILSWPGRLPEGQRRAAVVNLMDVTATILDAAGAPALPAANGRSFWRLAQDASTPWLDLTLSEYCTDATPYWTGGMAVQQRMLRLGRWKLVYYHGYPCQLFDLDADPDELQDRAGDPAHASVRDALLERLLADWDPEEVAGRMRRRVADKELVNRWARETRPLDTIRWPLTADQNRLEGWAAE